MLALLVLLAGATSALACSVPVFRYALEHWPPASYEIVVTHRGELAAAHEAMLMRVTAIGSNNPARANFRLRKVNLSAEASDDEVQLWKGRDLPAIILRHSAAPPGQSDVWSGPLDEENLQKVLDSPVRRRIVQRLIRGDSAVWVLLESGKLEQDEAAARVLGARLEHLQKVLKIQQLDRSDLASAETPPPEFKVAFSVLRVSRAEPGEEIFIRMLLNSEEDLSELKDPLVFPIFGRGRVLYALAGKGINPETIDEACSFLIGPCSCIVKDENPGFDLLMSAPWDSLVRITAVREQPLPELTGLTGVLPSSNFQSVAAPKEVPAELQTNANLIISESPPPPAASPFWRRVVLVPALVGALVVCATIALWRCGQGA